jgi:hypothetical protein
MNLPRRIESGPERIPAGIDPIWIRAASVPVRTQEKDIQQEERFAPLLLFGLHTTIATSIFIDFG